MRALQLEGNISDSASRVGTVFRLVDVASNNSNYAIAHEPDKIMAFRKTSWINFAEKEILIPTDRIGNSRCTNSSLAGTV
jgi:hypothetical protein